MYQKLNFMQKESLKALIFGSTGAVGSELVQVLLANPKWEVVHCIVRKSLPEWQKLTGRQKLKLQTFQDLDDYFKQENNKYEGYDVVFVCFGTQIKYGEELFVKIDKTYPLLAAEIALKNKIPQYSIVSSRGGDSSSCFLYLKVKGEVQEQLKTKKLNRLNIYKPGLLRNRKNARTGEKLFSCWPCVPKIEAQQCADVLRRVAQKNHSAALKSGQKIDVYQNNDMLNILEQ